MAKYTLLQEDDCKKIINRYDLTLLSFRYINGGAGNTSYLLYTKQGKYVLTVFENSLKRVDTIGKLLLLLEENQFPATRILPQKTGELTTNHLGKPVLIKRYIEGKVIENLDNFMLEQAGAQMARLHQVPPPNYLLQRNAYNIHEFSNAYNQNIDPNFEAWLKDRDKYLKQHIHPELPKCIIHADLFYDNLLFKNDILQAIIDFEDSCYYYRIFDLGMGILGLCTKNSLFERSKARAFIKGYQKQIQLNQQEIDSLKLFAEYAATGLAYWRFWMYNIHTHIENKTKSHRYMMRLAKEFNRIPNDEFKDSIFNY